MSEPRNQFSGGPIAKMEGGWGIAAFGGQKAHYWKDCTAEFEPTIYKEIPVTAYRSLCGVLAATHPSGGPMLEPGTFKQCKKCLRSAPTPPTEESQT